MSSPHNRHRSRAGTSRPGGARRVLLAEYDALFRDLLTVHLREAGYETTAIASGGELIDYVSRALRDPQHAPLPDLIVTDAGMPGVSGLDVLYGASRARLAVPVILITSFGGRESHDRACALGARAIFEKPFEIDRLIETVRALFDEADESKAEVRRA